MDISLYPTLDTPQLYAELIEVSRILSYAHGELGVMMGDHHKDFLTKYIQAPGNSVAAKSRDAEYGTSELMREIINTRGQINSLTIQRDLIIFLLQGQKPSELLVYPPATADEEGRVSA